MAATYSISAYDRNLCLKMSPVMWLIILFLCRAAIVFVGSIASKKDRMALINLFYGDRFGVVLGVLAAVPAILVLVAWMKRKAETKGLLRTIWHRGRGMLLLSTVLNILVVFFPVLTGDTRQLSYAGMTQVAILAVIAFEILRSPRIRDTFADYPEHAESGGGNKDKASAV